MGKYKRLTGQPWSKDIDLRKEYGYSHIYKRLYELENQIEKGLLLPKYEIVRNYSPYQDYDYWLVCSADYGTIIKQCTTNKEAKAVIKELIDNDE